MKIEPISLFLPGICCAFAVLVAMACTGDRTETVQVSLNFDLSRNRGPNSAADMDCVLVNVTGDNTVPTFADKTFNDGVTSTCLQLGTVSNAQTVTESTSTGIKLQVRPGTARTIEVLGYDGSLGTNCSGKNLNDLLNQPPASLYLLGKSTVDVRAATTVTIANTYTSTETDRVAGCKTGGSSNTASVFRYSRIGNTFARLNIQAKNIYALYNSGTNIYIGGEFDEANGIPTADNLVKYDDSNATFTAIGATPLNGPVRAIAKVGTNLYVGGDFTNAGGNINANRIARWNGSAWLALDNGITEGTVTAITAIGSNVYVGGTFTQINTIPAMGYFARWTDGSGTWQVPGAGIGGTPTSVDALLAVPSGLFIGGDFLDAGSNAFADYVVTFDQSTGIYAAPYPSSGVNGRVRALGYDGSFQYAGGDFTEANGDANGRHIAKMSAGWVALGTGADNTVYALGVATDLFAGGNFSSAGGAANTEKVALYNGSTWAGTAGGLNGKVTALAGYGANHVFVGGNFTDGATSSVP